MKQNNQAIVLDLQSIYRIFLEKNITAEGCKVISNSSTCKLK